MLLLAASQLKAKVARQDKQETMTMSKEALGLKIGHVSGDDVVVSKCLAGREEVKHGGGRRRTVEDRPGRWCKSQSVGVD